MSNYSIESVSEMGVSVRGTFVAWDTLRAAARQEDAELRAAYSAIYEAARERAIAQSPIVVSYGNDDSGVWFTSSVWTLWGEFGLPRHMHGLTIVAADEGGSLNQCWMAEREAKGIAERIRKVWPSREVRVRAGHEGKVAS
jgi:hypothetical protein